MLVGIDVREEGRRGPVVCSVYRAGGGSTYTRTLHSLLLTNYSTTVQYYVNVSLIRCVLL